MKYYDPTTRKRPKFKEWFDRTEGRAYLCDCGDILQTQQQMFGHWQQGHFDVYEECQED